MMTITEALSEINLIKKKLISKRAAIQQTLVRATHMPDVYEKEGGSRQFMSREMQSIADLNLRLIRIRSEISRVNQTTFITITEGELTISQSIHDWLIWKREVIKDLLSFMQQVTHAVKMHNDTASKQPQVYKDEKDAVALVKYEVNIHYPDWMLTQANLNAALEKLDGQLSLKNATTFILE
jgi:hypothetical protein